MLLMILPCIAHNYCAKLFVANYWTVVAKSLVTKSFIISYC